MNGSGGKSSHRACPTRPVPASFPPALSNALSQMPSVEDIVNKAIQIQQQQQTTLTTSSIPSPLPQAPPSSPVVQENPEAAQSEVPLPPQQQVESNESASGQPSLETPSEARPKRAPRAPKQAKRQREEDPAVQQSLIPPVLAEEAAPPQVLEEQAPRPPSPPIPKKSSQPAPRSILKMRKPAKEGDPETAFLLQKGGPAVPGFVVCSEDLKTEGRPFEGFRINSMSWQLIFPANTPGVGGKLITGFTKFPEVASCGACGWGQENFDLKLGIISDGHQMLPEKLEHIASC